MADYLLRGNAAEAAGGVNAYLSCVHRTVEHLSDSDIVDDPNFWRSVHPRADPRPPIELHHALLATP